MVKKSNSIGYPYFELCFCRVSNFPLPYFCLQISMNVPNISRFLFMPDSGCFLCFPLKFARENGAWAAKIAPLAYALRLTAVLLRSSFTNASETLGNNMKYLTSPRTRAFSEKRVATPKNIVCQNDKKDRTLRRDLPLVLLPGKRNF